MYICIYIHIYVYIYIHIYVYVYINLSMAEMILFKIGRYVPQVRESNLGPICPHPIVRVEELKEAHKSLFRIHPFIFIKDNA